PRGRARREKRCGTDEKNKEFEQLDDSIPGEIPPWADLPAPTTDAEPQRMSLAQMDASHWARLAAELPLSGWAAQIAKRSEWLRHEQGEVVLRLELRSVDDMQAKTRLNTVLNEYFGQPL